MAEISLYPSNPNYVSDLEKIKVKVPWEGFKGKSVTVTGATGLLGSHIIDFFLYLNRVYEASIEVIALGRNPQKIQRRFSYAMNSNLFKSATFELSGRFPEIDTDYIIHCAGNSHPQLFAQDPVGTLIGNVLGAEKVLKYGVCHDTKILLLSSGEVYGENLNGIIPMEEDYTGKLDLSSSRSCYTEGKRAVEALGQSYKAQYGVDVVIARPCRIFGPTMTSEDNKASAQFIRNGLENKDIVLKSPGEQMFSYIYSSDAVSALLTILIKGKSGEAYNVANDRCNVRLKDFAKEVAKKANVRLTFNLIGEPGGSKVTNAVLDTAKLQSLGWTPAYDLSQGVEQTLKILK